MSRICQAHERWRRTDIYFPKWLTRLLPNAYEEERRIVVVRFESVEKAKEFWNSPEYANARKERVGAAEFDAVIVEGV